LTVLETDTSVKSNEELGSGKM